jgi:hypothetical protein
VRYQHFAKKWMLPTRRLELLLAQVSLTTAQANGATNATLAEYLFDPEEDTSTGDDLEDAKDFFGFNPIG